MDDQVSVSEAPPSGRRAPRRRVRRELPLLLLLALVFAVAVKTVAVQAFSIPTGSMEHTLEVGDRVAVDKLVYRFRAVHRGEVVVFDGTDDWAPQSQARPARGSAAKALRAVGTALGLVPSTETDYVKRVIGLPGERVMCCSTAGRVAITSASGRQFELNEGYLLEAADDLDSLKYFCAAGRGRPRCPPGAAGVLVPDGRLWVMGDHRGRSADSRAHTDDSYHGTIAVAAVIGRARAVIYPVGRLGGLGSPEPLEAPRAAPAAPLARRTLTAP